MAKEKQRSMLATDLDRLTEIITNLSDEDIRAFVRRFDESTKTVKVRLGYALRHLRSTIREER